MAAQGTLPGKEIQPHVRDGVAEIRDSHAGIAAPELLGGDVGVDQSRDGDEVATHIGTCRFFVASDLRLGHVSLWLTHGIATAACL